MEAGETRDWLAQLGAGQSGELVPAPGVTMAPGGWQMLRGLWAAGQPLFQGRALLVTNTLGCGALMAVGDGARQSWEIRVRPGQRFDPRRSGEDAGAAGPSPPGTFVRT